MGAVSATYGEIEIGLHRVQPQAYEVELRVTDPGTEGEVAPVRGQAQISLSELQSVQYSPLEYGEKLANQLFQDPKLRKFFGRNSAAFDARGIMLRLRLLIGPSAAELNSLRWELLVDPDTRQQFTTSERILFSRFTLSRDWRVIKLRPKAELKAIIAVSAPDDLTDYGLADVDKADVGFRSAPNAPPSGVAGLRYSRRQRT